MVKPCLKHGESLFYYFTKPLSCFYKQKNFSIIIIIIFFYKISDAYLDTMLVPFFLEIGFPKEDIAFIAKISGIVGTFIGTFVGTLLLTKHNIIFILFIAEIVASLTNLQFIIFIYT